MDYIGRFQRVFMGVLMVMMGLVVLASTIELAYLLAVDLISPPFLILDIDELLNIFGYFLLVLIGIEILETLRIYAEEQAINVQVVFMLAMIAIARKVIIIDVKTMPDLTLIGIGAIIIALSVGYFLVKKSQTEESCKRL